MSDRTARAGPRPGRVPPSAPGDPVVDGPGGGLALVAFGLPLAVYALTAARHPLWGDSTELLIAGRTLSIPHPTGYPLYLLLAHVIGWLPVGPEPWRAAMLSALAAAAAVWVFWRIASRLTGDGVVALLGALGFAFTHEVWEQATQPEVYALHLALSGAAMLACLRFLDDPGGGHGEKRLLLLSFLLGLSFSNHMQTVFLVPAVAAACWLARAALRPGIRRGAIARAALVFLVPLGLYGALMVRAHGDPFFDEGGVGTVTGLVAHVTGAQFRYRMFHGDGQDWLWKETSRLASEVGTQPCPWWPASVPYLILALVGARALRGQWPIVALLGVTALADLVYTVGYNIPDKGAYYLPFLFVLGLLCTVGAAEVAGRLRRSGRGRLARGLAVLAIVPLFTTAGVADRSGDVSLVDYTADISRSAPRGSLIVTDDLTLWWGFVWRRSFEGQDQDKSFVNTYGLRLPWTLPFLRRVDPSLSLPRSLDTDLAQALAGIERDGDASGVASQKLVDRLAWAIVDANIDRRPVCVVVHSTNAELKTWGPFHLQPLGLLYRVHRAPHPAEPYAAEFADPARHRVGRVHGVDAVRVAKRYSTALNRLGILEIEKGRYDRAERAFLAALEYEPEYPGVHVNLGVLFAEKLGRPDKAQTWFLRYLDLAPDDPQSRGVIDWLGRYQQSLVREGRPPR